MLHLSPGYTMFQHVLFPIEHRMNVLNRNDNYLKTYSLGPRLFRLQRLQAEHTFVRLHVFLHKLFTLINWWSGQRCLEVGVVTHIYT